MPEVQELFEHCIAMAKNFVEKHGSDAKLSKVSRHMEKMLRMMDGLKPKNPTKEQEEAEIGVHWPVPEGYDESKVTGAMYTGKGVDHELAHKLSVDAGKRMT